MADNDKVLVLPDGFILHGIMKLKSNFLLDRGVSAVNGGNYGIQVNNGTQAYFEGPAQYYSYSHKDKSYYGVANR